MKRLIKLSLLTVLTTNLSCKSTSQNNSSSVANASNPCAGMYYFKSQVSLEMAQKMKSLKMVELDSDDTSEMKKGQYLFWVRQTFGESTNCSVHHLFGCKNGVIEFTMYHLAIDNPPQFEAPIPFKSKYEKNIIVLKYGITTGDVTIQKALSTELEKITVDQIKNTCSMI